MPYTLPLGVDVYEKVTVFPAGTIPLIAAGGALMALDFDASRIGMFWHNDAAANADFILYGDSQNLTNANGQRLNGGTGIGGIRVWDFPPRNRMFILAATAAAELRISELLVQPYRQAVSPSSRQGQRVRSNV